jgi:hypothetical protein
MAHTSENTTGFLTLPATAAALGLGVRVKLDSSGNVSAAGATDSWIGVTTHTVAASGNATIRLRNSSGSLMVQAAGAVTVGNRLYAAASGKWDDAQTAGPFTGFIAKTASGADGDIIEAVPATDSPAAGVFCIPVTLANIAGAGDVVTNFPLTFAGTITAFDFIVTTAVTTGSKAADLNLEIGTTNVTGGVLSLTSATATPLGKVLSSTAITGNNTFASGDTLSVEAASVTAFAEGAGVLIITYARN